ncbi:MAG: DUF3800 domain-containing protein [Thermoplasmata archaeon]
MNPVPPERYYAFIDESELGDEGEYVARAGFILPQSRIEQIGTQFEGILDRRGVPRHDPRVDCEVKYSPPKTNYFHDLPDRHLIYQELIRLIETNGGVALGIVVARERMSKWSRADARHHSFTYLLERVEMCLRSCDGRGCLFLDKSARGRDEHNPVAIATQLIREGSDFEFRFTRIDPELRPLDSKEWNAIQLADLTVGVTARKVREYIRRRRGEISAAAATDQYAATIWEPLRGRFMLLPGVDPKRFGLRIFPSGYESGFVTTERPYP